MSNWGAKGSLFERQVKAYYESQGYYVIKSGGSLGAFDLIGIRHGKAIGVQCKNRKAPISVSEWNKIYEISCGSGILPYLAEKIQGTSTFNLCIITETRVVGSKSRKGSCMAECIVDIIKKEKKHGQSK